MSEDKTKDVLRALANSYRVAAANALKRINELEAMLPDADFITCMWCGRKERKGEDSKLVDHIISCKNSPTVSIAKDLVTAYKLIEKLRARLTNVEYYGCAEDSEEANQGLKDDDELAEGGGK